MLGGGCMGSGQPGPLPFGTLRVVDRREDAERIVRDVVAQADRAIVSAGEGRRLQVLLARADRELARKLAAVVRVTGGPHSRFTEARIAAYQAQVHVATKRTQVRLGKDLSRQAKAAVTRGLNGAVKVISAMESAHRGAAVKLEIEKAQVLDSLSRRRTGSLLMQHERSLERYGRGMVLRMEREIMTGLLLGEPQWQIVERLTGIGIGRNKPGMFEGSEWRAKRIVVTEVAYAHNVVQLDAIVEMRREIPDMAKKIVATFDARTAPDSVYVHGQIRDVGELFTDGAGRQYEHPPARPHDREVLIPWRKAWAELDGTRPRPAEEVAAAKVACLPKSAPSQVKKTARASARAAVKADRAQAKAWREEARRLYGP